MKRRIAGSRTVKREEVDMWGAQGWPERGRRPIWCMAALLAMFMLLPGPVLSLSTPVPVPVTEQAAVSGHYGIEVTFSPAARQLAGRMSLDWINTTGVTADMLPFRLYPASALYEDGDLRVSDVRVDGMAVESQVVGEGTVLEVPSGDAIEPGGGVTVSMDFVTTIPDRSDMTVTVLSGSEKEGWWLADWYPILAGWEDGRGWFVEEGTPYGDPTYSDSATYEVELVAPQGLMVVGTGQATAMEPAIEGMARTSIATPPVREMTLSLLPDSPEAPVDVTERLVDGVLVRVSLPAGKVAPGLADAMLDVAEETIPHFNAWLGMYPGTDLDLSPVSLAGFGGIAWSGAVWIDIDAFVQSGEIGTSEWDQLQFVLAHELAHQWVPVVIGSNNNRHGFMSEGLASTLAILAIRESGDPAAAERFLREQVAAGYLRLLSTGSDGVADAPVTAETDMGRRAALVYGKAAIGFEAIRQEVGHTAFVAALSRYGEQYRFRNSTPENLLAVFEGITGRSLDEVWSFWFLEAECTPAHVEEVLSRFSVTEA